MVNSTPGSSWSQLSQLKSINQHLTQEEVEEEKDHRDFLPHLLLPATSVGPFGKEGPRTSWA